MSYNLVWAGESYPEMRDGLATFVSRQYGAADVGFGKRASAGVFVNDEIAGAVIFHNWQPTRGTVEISAASASRAWLNVEILNALMTYAFEGLGCQMVFARTAESNTAARRMCAAIGADEVVLPRHRGPDEAEVIMTLTEDAWRNSRFRR